MNGRRQDPIRCNELKELDSFVVQRQGSAPTHSGPPATAVSAAGPVRMCVGCRARTLTAELLRVVIVDGVVVLDVRRRLPGRGAWIHPDLGCLRAAERRRAFSRALRLSQGAGPLDLTEIYAHLEQQQHTVKSGPGKQVDPS